MKCKQHPIFPTHVPFFTSVLFNLSATTTTVKCQSINQSINQSISQSINCPLFFSIIFDLHHHPGTVTSFCPALGGRARRANSLATSASSWGKQVAMMPIDAHDMPLLLTYVIKRFEGGKPCFCLMKLDGITVLGN